MQSRYFYSVTPNFKVMLQMLYMEMDGVVTFRTSGLHMHPQQSLKLYYSSSQLKHITQPAQKQSPSRT